ncbi:uncharacterized protein LOC114356421 [Ostrinia furnacalis]|uniref:uncharacterized protein LOC114356421 n=1 Tax=Ostrinia furnacalis TaxID=93504 RepID=UPI0010396DEA|nr:uncharacterized protein LOC114356421 [Ostrinia furnacalis]
MPRGRLISHAQVETLLSLLEANTEIARGRMVGGALASQRVDEFWRNTARTLNSIGDGTSKEAAAWKTYWHELKYRARKRDTEVRQHARGTGGGPAKKPLTVTESRILQLLGEVSYAGNPEVQIPLNIPSCSGPVPSTVGTRPNVPSLSRAPAPVPSCYRCLGRKIRCRLDRGGVEPPKSETLDLTAGDGTMTPQSGLVDTKSSAFVSTEVEPTPLSAW